MPKYLDDTELERLGVARKQPEPLPEPAAPAVDTTPIAESITQFGLAVVKAMGEQHRAIKAMKPSVVIEPAPRPESWEFTIERDQFGRIQTVKARSESISEKE